MKSSIFKMASQFLREKKSRKKWLTIFLCLALVVGASTFVALHMTGRAMTRQVKMLNCSLDDEQIHQHTADCYAINEEGTRTLVCGEADYVVHQHNDDCYVDGVLVCSIPERAKHIHTEACYADVLVCGQEEAEGHSHTEECYAQETSLSCEMEEHEHAEDCYDEEGGLICELEEHTHTDECYEINNVLTCGLAEGDGAHTHTAECFAEEKVLTCGELELHTHDETCFEKVEEGKGNYSKDKDGNFVEDKNGDLILTCEEIVLEEHVHSEADGCFEIVTIANSEVEAYVANYAINAISANAPLLSDVTSLPGGSLIIDVKQKGGSSWGESSEFEDGDEISITVNYVIPADALKNGQRVLEYYLPDFIDFNKFAELPEGATYNIPIYQKQGENDDPVEVGTVIVSADGKVLIEFNNQLDPSMGVEGGFTLAGKINKDKGSSGGHFQFPGGDTTVDIVDGSDLHIKKTASAAKKNANGKWEIDYTVEVWSNGGTGGRNVTVHDSFTSGPKGNVNKNSVQVKDQNGNTVGFEWVKNPDNGEFEIKLPPMNAGDRYTITYTAEIDNLTGHTDANGKATTTNKAKASDGRKQNPESSTTTTVQEPQISKSGVSTKTGVDWTITVAEGNGGQILRDIFSGSTKAYVESIADTIIVNVECVGCTNCTHHGQITLADLINGYQIPEGDDHAHIFTYSTPATTTDQGKDYADNFTNEGKIGDFTSGKVEAKPNIKSWNSGKSGRSSEDIVEDGKVTKERLNWRGTIQFPDGKWENATYVDTFIQTATVNGTTISVNHYALLGELKEELEEALNAQTAGHRFTYTITYMGTDGSTYTGDAPADTHVIGFTINFESNGSFEAGSYDSWTLTLEYHSLVDTTDFESDANYTITNKSWVNGTHERKADLTFNFHDEDGKHLEKMASLNQYGNYTAGDLNLTYDADGPNQNGDITVYFQLAYRFSAAELANDELSITITDLIPAGMQLNTNSISYYYATYNNGSYSSGNAVNGNVQKTITANEDGTTSLQITFSAESLNKRQSTTDSVIVRYAVTISADTLKALAESGASLKNIASAGEETVEHDTKVYPPSASKMGEQIKDEKGNLTSKVKYTLEVNTSEREFGSDPLTLIDTIELRRWTTPDNPSNNGTQAVPKGALYLDYSSVKIYRYDPNQPDHKGELLELDPDKYGFSLESAGNANDGTKYTLTVTIPDATALVLEYTYAVDTADVVGPVLKNSVSIEGDLADEIESEVKEVDGSAWANQAYFPVYKVDEDNSHRLPNAEFDVYKWDPNAVTGNNETGAWVRVNSSPIVTDEKGMFYFNQSIDPTNNSQVKLEKGAVYAIVETKAPDNYELNTAVRYVGYLDMGNSELNTVQKFRNYYGNHVRVFDINNSWNGYRGGNAIQFTDGDKAAAVISPKFSGTGIEFTNKRNNDDLIIQKKDQFGNKLDGAVFDLYVTDENGTWTLCKSGLTSDADGKIKLTVGQTGGKTDASYNRIYALVETTFPTGVSEPDENATYFWYAADNTTSAAVVTDTYSAAFGTKPNSAKNEMTEDSLQALYGENNSSTLTIINETETTKITVQKLWLEDDPKDRPDEITLVLKRYIDGKGKNSAIEVGSITLSSAHYGDNVWEYTWENLPKTDGKGNKYRYFVEEIVVDGYKASYGNNEGILGDDDGPIVVTNTPGAKKGEIIVEKVWLSPDGTEDWNSHDSITVELWRKGTGNNGNSQTPGDNNSGTTDNGSGNTDNSGSGNNENAGNSGNNDSSSGDSNAQCHFILYRYGIGNEKLAEAWVPQNAQVTMTVTYASNCWANLSFDPAPVSGDMSSPNGAATRTFVFNTSGSEYAVNAGGGDYAITNVSITTSGTRSISGYTAVMPISAINSDSTSYAEMTEEELLAAGWEKVNGRSITLSSGNKWKGGWKDLDTNYEYLVREVTVDGYTTTYEYTYYDANGTEHKNAPSIQGNTGIVTIYNTNENEPPAYELPETGGKGMIPFAAAGTVVLFGGAAYATIRRRRRYQ